MFKKGSRLKILSYFAKNIANWRVWKAFCFQCI
jgi:hypothetical protein